MIKILKKICRPIALVLLFIGLTQNASANEGGMMILETTKGTIKINLRPDLAPKHVERMKTLIKQGFFDGVIFHRVIEGFMAQTGDPTGTGTGGSDLPDLKAEFTDTPFKRGIVGMARARDPDSANSQFFIMFEDGNFLNGKYTVFGEVTEGMDVVDSLNRGEPPADPDKIIKATLEDKQQGG